MYKKMRKTLWFAGFVLIAATAFTLLACRGGGSRPPEEGGWVGLPGPAMNIRSEVGAAFAHSVNLGSATEVQAALDAQNFIPIISFQWTAVNAQSFNISWSEQAVRPAVPNVTGHPYTSFFIREGLEWDTMYFFWIDTVNPNGVTLGEMMTPNPYRNQGRTSLLPQVQVLGDHGDTLERADYARQVQVEAGDGQLTVWWELRDRVGWHEVYIVRSGTFPAVMASHRTQFPNSAAGTPWAGNAYGNHNTSLAMAFTDTAISVHGNHWTGWVIQRDDGLGAWTANRPALGVNQFGEPGMTTGTANQLGRPTRPAAGSFPFIGESWFEGEAAQALGRLVPYRVISADNSDLVNFNQFGQHAIPWDHVNQTRGTPGNPIRHWNTHVTITGLENGQTYEVWIRVPNVNGERGFMVVEGTPGVAPFPAPNLRVRPMEGETRQLLATWNGVSGGVTGLSHARITGLSEPEIVWPTHYRIYHSPANIPPGPMTPFTRVPSVRNTTVGGQLITDALYAEFTYMHIIPGLMPGSVNYVWVVAERNGVAGAFGAPGRGRTEDATVVGWMPENRYDRWGNPIRTLVYIEVNNVNPLNVGSYVLEDGRFLFDYVVIFASNVVQDSPGGQIRLVHNANVQHILDNRDRYIAPLQAKGIRVLLGLLPHWSGVGLGTMNQQQINDFALIVRETMIQFGLDGVDFDDEWGNLMDDDGWVDATTPSPNAIMVYPHHPNISWFAPNSTTGFWRDPTMGVVPGNTLLSNPGPALVTEMWQKQGRTMYMLMRAVRDALPRSEGFTIALYEFGSARHITPGGNDNTGIWGPVALNDASAPVTTVTLAQLVDVVDIAMQPWYNAWHNDSPNMLPRNLFSPLAIDLGGHAYAGQNNAPNPPLTGGNSIHVFAQRFAFVNSGGTEFTGVTSPPPLTGVPYGVMFFYDLRPSSQLLSREPGGPANMTREEYLSMLTRPIFGMDVILTADGGDFPRDW